MIELESVSKSYGKTKALDDINLYFPKGAVTAIAGPNGSGKTTLIKSILGLVNIDSGDIKIEGKSALRQSEYRSRIGYMPQIARYPENLRVTDVISMVKKIRNSSTQANDEELLDTFGLQPFTSQFMRNLSGGTRQKVGLVMAFMYQPEIYILDEPTAGLDPVSSGKLKNLLALEKESGKTIIYITHLLGEISGFAENFAYIIDGKIILKDKLDALIDNSNYDNLEQLISKLLTNKNGNGNN
ncbi:MAG: transporter ATP-binding protein [Ignavibacteria bacterium]|nr:transporter ATP-binding protein [Ignavibacteria bacterium]